MEHERLPSALTNAVKSGQLLHAYLLESNAAVFPVEKAMAFARMLACQNSSDAPCGHCDACKLSAEGENPDIIVFEPEKDQIRKEVIDAIREQSVTAPFISARKVFVICRAECLNLVAQNKFLKLLEEPPRTVSFLLLSGAADQLLPTVLSRVGRRSLDEIGQDGETGFTEPFVARLDRLLSDEVLDAVSLAEDFAKSDSPRSEIGMLMTWFGAVLCQQQGQSAPLDEKLSAFARTLPKKATLSILNHLGTLERDLRYNIKKEAAITATLLRCWEEIHDRDCGN